MCHLQAALSDSRCASVTSWARAVRADVVTSQTGTGRSGWESRLGAGDTRCEHGGSPSVVSVMRAQKRRPVGRPCFEVRYAQACSACAPHSKGMKIVGRVGGRDARNGAAPHGACRAAHAARTNAEISAAEGRRLGQKSGVEEARHRGDSNKVTARVTHVVTECKQLTQRICTSAQIVTRCGAAAARDTL